MIKSLILIGGIVLIIAGAGWAAIKLVNLARASRQSHRRAEAAVLREEIAVQTDEAHRDIVRDRALNEQLNVRQ